MPKVSDYELEHLDDDQFEIKKQKKTKVSKEKKFVDKKSRKNDWKALRKSEPILETDDSLDDF